MNTSSNYGLIRSDSMNMSDGYEVMSATIIDKNKKTITFIIPSSLLTNGYYTIGTKDRFSDSLFVQIYSFNVINYKDYNLIIWNSTFELDNLGYNIWRSSKNNDFIKINESLIFAMGDTITGNEYFFIDNDIIITDKVYNYKLEAIDIFGESSFYIPEKIVKSIVSGQTVNKYDINEDGKIDIGDVIYILKVLMKKD